MHGMGRVLHSNPITPTPTPTPTPTATPNLEPKLNLLILVVYVSRRPPRNRHMRRRCRQQDGIYMYEIQT